jgi:hypothetical protein
MDRIANPQARRTRTASEAVRALRLLLPLLGSVSILLAFASTASAFKVISEAGEGAGKTKEPRGLAVDYETGRLFVADAKNNRVDVFDKTGTFEKAYGWGVKNGSSQLQVCTAASTCRKGLEGAGNGQFSRPSQIAVDNSPTSPSRHDVYVVDRNNNRVEKFDPEGNFILAFGSAGEGEGQFSNASGGIFVGIGPGGVVYVLDSVKSGSEFKARLQRFEPSGAEITPQQVLVPAEPFGAQGLAVDSSGDFYLISKGIPKYEVGNATPIAEIAEPFEEGVEGGRALAVDSEDDLFVIGSEGSETARISITEFDSAGNRLRRFGYGAFSKPLALAQAQTAGLAPYHSASGDIYASEQGTTIEENRGYRVLHIDFSAPGPLVFPTIPESPGVVERQSCSANPLGNTKVTLNAEIVPEGKATTYHFQYLTQAQFEAGGFSNPGVKTTPESPSIGADFTLHKANAEVEVLPETKYHCRVIATNADAPAGIEGEEGTFTTKEPFEILDTWSTDVGFEAARLNATVNPLSVPTNGYFEYVIEATYQHDIAESGPGHGFDHAARAPVAPEELDFGAGEAPKSASAQVSGLSPGTRYRYRITVDDHLIAPRSGPTESFRTFAGGEGALPDGRAWELVSPAQKNSAEVGIPGPPGGLFAEQRHIRVQAAAGSGEAITYTSWTSFGQPEGSPSASQYLSKRTPSGWGTQNISPFSLHAEIVSPPYRGFTPDLRFGAFVTTEPPLTPQAQEDSQNLYLRDNETGALQALTIEAPQGEGFCAGYAGASADGKRAFFAGRGAMAGAPVGPGFSLYEWSAAEGLALVSVLPDASPAPPVSAVEAPGVGTGFGAVGGNCLMDQRIVHNAVSEDGSVAFWTYGGTYEGANHPLFARIGGTETVQLDAKPAAKAGKGPFGEGKFRAATADGSKAFFTTPGKLTKSAEAAGQLYRYDTGARSLTDLTPGEIAPEGIGVIGVSEDGTYAYFTAPGALSGEEEGAAGEKAVKGANNLYLWHEGEGLRFIAALSVLDTTIASPDPEELNARITPDGRHLAFLSVESEALSGYDNTIFPGTGCQPGPENALEGDPRCPEAYLYDAEAKALTCVSCNPSGSRPRGPAQLPGWTNPYEGPRYLSDDGSRLYFESRDALSAADENDRRDAYEFERQGAGDCTSQSHGFDPASGGCHFLISSGKSDDESYLLDASADGRDAFFSTRSRLVGWDTNENYDVYNARAGGGFPEPSQEPACADEACKPPADAAPPSTAPATPNFQGPGNEVHKPKAKKHKHKSKHKKKRGRANHRQGTGR